MKKLVIVFFLAAMYGRMPKALCENPVAKEVKIQEDGSEYKIITFIECKDKEEKPNEAKPRTDHRYF